MQIKNINRGQAGDILLHVLLSALKTHQSVAWFLPGGSNIPISVQVLAQIPSDLTAKLIIAQTDERYGDYDHPDSNWLQLKDTGLKLAQAKAVTILSKSGKSLAATVEYYQGVVKKLLSDTYTIGQFGIGSDGHIAGIKPSSPATEATGLMSGYTAEDFTRITMTFDAIKQLNEAHAFVFGSGKRKTLESLANQSTQPSYQPCQILKSVDKSFVYNDQVGES